MNDFHPEWIWGDDAETTVFAQGYGNDRTIILSFSLDASKPPTSLANRICACMHRIEVDDDSKSFKDSAAMREALWNAVRDVWPACSNDERASHPDVVFAIDYHDDENSFVCVSKFSSRPPLSSISSTIAHNAEVGKTPPLPNDEQIEFASIIRYDQLGGQGCATRIRRMGKGSEDFMVFKGIDFRTFLTYADDEGDKTIRHMIHGWHRSNDLLRNMPRHPNVLPAPSKLVTCGSQSEHGSLHVVCGKLQPFYVGGDVGSRIEKSNALRTRIPLATKVQWCADMAAAVAHLHRQAKTYHMDIKPGNFLIDRDDNLVLGDWEQTDAPTTTTAPEADGTWDVETGEGAGFASNGLNRPRLRYTKYEGPPRRNTEEDVLGDYPWNTWNVFPGWSAEHPLALELAEVFSLGRAMWMLLRQPDMNFDEIEHPSQLKTSWEGAQDIPSAWVDMTDRCMAEDPNERPDTMEVLGFWQAEMASFSLSSV
ncbi:nima-related kinase 5 [Colletotrichum kahawae]|uniref:Nima-related kinase 5 n=1 Tax=Colletotrichum kahawae TaxID=34407 RepID=A0AAD9YW38_COLKA|nr:nima-related kinase 5 [Colletotrichum kahawae]